MITGRSLQRCFVWYRYALMKNIRKIYRVEITLLPVIRKFYRYGVPGISG
jgi:hypothetical protein